MLIYNWGSGEMTFANRSDNTKFNLLYIYIYVGVTHKRKLIKPLIHSFLENKHSSRAKSLKIIAEQDLRVPTGPQFLYNTSASAALVEELMICSFSKVENSN